MAAPYRACIRSAHLLMAAPYRACIRSAHLLMAAPYRACIRSAHLLMAAPYRACIRSAHLLMAAPYRACIRSAHLLMAAPYRACIRSAHLLMAAPYQACIRSAHPVLRFFETLLSFLSFSTITRSVCPISRRVATCAERRRHPRTIVRNGAGCVKGRTPISERYVSVETAMLGNNVMPVPLATICASVGRLVARKPSSSILVLAQYSITWSRKQCPSLSSRTRSPRKTVRDTGDEDLLSLWPTGVARTNGSL